MRNLLGLTLEQLEQLCKEEGFPRFAAKQICDWLYVKRVDSIAAMTNLSIKARARLSEIASLEHVIPVNCQVSRDGTKKYLFPILQEKGMAYVEAVFIPDGERGTLCLSCQVGCKMGCRFCVTGKQGFHGNLSVSDIVNQVIALPEYERLTNIVFMGMGEPMDNYDNVLQATEVLTSTWGMAWSPRRITVSTVGITPMLKRFLNESQCHVAVSLHNPFSEQRLEVMPMEKPYPIAETIELLKRYDWSGQRRISFEYTLFKGLNDTQEHAHRLVEMLKGFVCRVNLIRYHPSPDLPYRTPSDHDIFAFRDYLNQHGVVCTLRASRGQDIMAACGLLAGQKK